MFVQALVRRRKRVGLLAAIVTAMVVSTAVLTAGTVANAQTPNGPPMVKPGPVHTFDRVTVPLECAVDYIWKEAEFWGHQRRDTATFARAALTRQPATMAQARACVARFNLATLGVPDLLGLGEAYLAANQPDLAEQAFAKLAAAVAKAPVATQAWTYYQIVTAYTGVPRPEVQVTGPVYLETPPLLAQAAPYLSKLDALGAPAAPERLQAHYRVLLEAQRRDSLPLQAQELEAGIKASKELTGDNRRIYAIVAARLYAAGAYYKVRMNDAVGATALLSEGRSIWVPLRPSVGGQMNRDGWVAPIGSPAPPIQATFWYNGGAAGNARPVKGKPSLVIFATARCKWCYTGYAALRRLQAKYGPKGLDITIVTRTGGYYGESLTPPDSEAVKVRDYFLDYLKLPVTLAVWKTDFSRRDDNKLIIESNPNEQSYQPVSTGTLWTFVVDSQGIVRYVEDLGEPRKEILFDNILASLF